MSDHHLIGPFVRRFLVEDLVANRNFSVNTQRSYRDAIRLLFHFVAERHSTDPTRVTVEQLDADVVRAFLTHLEDERGNSVTTRNQRLAALHSLFRFIGRQVPELVHHATQIQAIAVRRTSTPVMAYLDKCEMDALLAIPDRARALGRRDYALLLFLYNTGARASEAAQLAVADLALDAPPSVRLHGKGRKIRVCPLWPHTAEILRDLLGTHIEGDGAAPVFLNVRRRPITRHGVYALVRRAAKKATSTTPSLSHTSVTPHTLRHTAAMGLLRAGVDVNTIRAWLGHVSLETTNRYVEIDLEMKAQALAKCAVTESAPERVATPTWHDDSELMSFLESL